MEFTQLALIDEKVQQLKKIIYPEKLSIPTWKTRTATYTVPVEYVDHSEWSEMTLGQRWTCRFDEARWFEAEVVVPEHFAGKRLVLELNLGGEGLVSINGQPKSSLAFYYKPGHSVLSGVIRPRTRVDVTDCAVAGEVLHISAQMNINYKDHYKSNRFQKYSDAMTATYTLGSAELCTVDAEAEGYYFDVTNLLDAINLLYTPADFAMGKLQTCKLDLQFDRMLRNMNRDAGLRQQMVEALQTSMAVIPFFYEPDAMRQAVPHARQILKAAMEKLPQVERGNVSATGFSHVDMVWLWQEKHTVRKLANTFLNALSLLERYPEYIFSFSQPYAFALLEKHYPDIFKRVQEMVAAGRIDPVGNLWVEMDTNITGGEAMVRQLLYGRAYYLEKFGKDSDVFFMPDSFGYTASLPQVMKKSGIKYFFTDKLAAFNERYRFPHTFFQWQGIDGTKVPAYLERCSYNGCLNCERVDETYHRAENKRIIDTAYITVGYGDGGGGADYVMAENGRRLQNMPGIPKVKMQTVGEFFADVTKNLDQFPVWNDELYLDGHRGTYTTHADAKRNNRRSELALRETEIAAWMREQALGIAYPAEKIEQLWKMILPMQFHDTLPGTCITQAYEDCAKVYAAFFRKQQALLDEILSDLTAAVPHEKGQSVAWNFLPWERTAQVRTGEGVKSVTVPSMGWAVISDASCGEAITVTPQYMENKFFRITLDEKGHLVSLIHKETGREALKAPSNVFEIFDDPAKATMSAWDIHPEYQNVMQTIEDVQSIRVVEANEKRGVLRVVRAFHNSTISQDITIYSDIPRIDFVTHVDWQECMRLLKAAFYPKVQTSKASYEIQFGAIERPTHRNTDYDEMRFEACAHKWADMSQSDFGVSLLNDCKYGYDVFDGKMRLTMLRAPLEPDYLADRGEHDFVYSLYPHAGNWSVGGTVQAGFELNTPLRTCDAVAEDANLRTASFISVDSRNVVLDSIKKAENGEGYIIRLYEACGGGGDVTVRFAKEIKQVIACDLMENNEGALPVNGSSFTFETTPYCIHSFRII